MGSERCRTKMTWCDDNLNNCVASSTLTLLKIVTNMLRHASDKRYWKVTSVREQYHQKRYQQEKNRVKSSSSHLDVKGSFEWSDVWGQFGNHGEGFGIRTAELLQAVQTHGDVATVVLALRSEERWGDKRYRDMRWGQIAGQSRVEQNWKK